jgi:hypothetical protein
MARRKTINVDSITAQINDMIRLSTGTPQQRQGLLAAIETILHETGNYKGFRYLTQNEVPAGFHRPGINISHIDGQHLENYDARFENTDRTRVAYFLS